MRVLVTWIGLSDLAAAGKDDPERDPGPVLRLLRSERFDRIHLLNDVAEGAQGRDRAGPAQYRAWLARTARLDADTLVAHDCDRNLKNSYADAYAFTRDALQRIRGGSPADARFGLLLSPGYPAAQVAMLIAAQTLFDPGAVELFNTWDPRGSGRDSERVELPFSLRVDLVAPALRRWARQVEGPANEAAFTAVRGRSTALDTARRLAGRVAPFDKVCVLLRGGSGTGKELFARSIHGASPRRGRPFVALNCAAIPATLLEGELFGHVKGAFTGATANRAGLVRQADGGTLFLDEIGDMPPDLQAKLLRFLQERRYRPVGAADEEAADVRILAATHQDLDAAIRTGRFRADLFYRLEQVRIDLPPLRERGDDVGELAAAFLEKFSADNGVPAEERKRLSAGALAELGRRPWPGNVRELQNAVTRLAVFAPGPEITAQDVADWVGRPPPPGARPLGELDERDFLNYLAAVVDELVCRWHADRLPAEARQEGDLLEAVVEPLVRGRARELAGSGNAAGQWLGTTVDRSKAADARRFRYYEAIREQWLDPEVIRRLRGSGR
jgi:DNA-binding NtrC family response regulator